VLAKRLSRPVATPVQRFDAIAFCALHYNYG